MIFAIKSVIHAVTVLTNTLTETRTQNTLITVKDGKNNSDKYKIKGKNALASITKTNTIRVQ